MKTGRILRMVCLAIFVFALFANAAFAERERPRRDSSVRASEQAEAAASKEPEKREVVIERPGKPGRQIGKWSTTKSFTNDCSGWCDDFICVCEEDWWDPGCCEVGCVLCWIILDNT